MFIASTTEGKKMSYFEFSNYSVLICDILVIIITTFSSEQVETVQPVLKVVKLTLKFLLVHLIGPKNISWNIYIFLNVLLSAVASAEHLQLLQLWLLLLSWLCWLLLLLLAFSSFAAFHWRVISFDFWVQVCEGGGRVRWVGGWKSRELQTWIPHESCQQQQLLSTASTPVKCILLQYTFQWQYLDTW